MLAHFSPATKASSQFQSTTIASEKQNNKSYATTSTGPVGEVENKVQLSPTMEITMHAVSVLGYSLLVVYTPKNPTEFF